MATYSTQFYSDVLTASGALQALYSVPAGKLVVVRDLEVLAGTTGSFFTFNAGAGGHFNFQGSATGSLQYQWKGRVVIPSGGTLSFEGTNGDTFRIVASGYLLTSP